MPRSGQSAATTPSGFRWKNWGLALPQELYGEDLVTAMTKRVNFTVNHYQHSVAHWDVINEMVNQGTVSHEFYMEHTGDPLIRWKFRKFRNCSMFPDQKCSSLPRASPLTHCSSSMTMESSWTGRLASRLITNWLRNGRFALFQQQIRDLLAQGAPIDALGQLHDWMSLLDVYNTHGGKHPHPWTCEHHSYRIAVTHGITIGGCGQVSPLISI